MENGPREVAGYLAAYRIHAWNGCNYACELTESLGIRDSGSAVRVGWCASTTLRTWTVCQRRSRISMVTASLMETCLDGHTCRDCPS
jgi:selenocysteine lyase/cysteine desulfurase